jgi:hypothetical protein
MKILVIVAWAMAMSSSAYAADKDTIPLKKPTAKVKQEPDYEEAKKNIEEAMPKPYIAGIETFGTTRINETLLRQFLGKELDAWIEKGLAGSADSPAIEEQLAKKIQNKFGFESANWTVMQLFEPGNLAVYLTLDVVEKEDKAARMPFLPDPMGEVRDPDGLIKTWNEYEETALELVESGGIEPDSGPCVAFHCPFGHRHLKLKKYEKIFVDGVNRNEKGLAEVLARDKRPLSRAAAAFLLAYLKDGKKVVGYMSDRLRDPSDHVRNNVLRVLGDIAEFHPEFPISAKPILEILNYPRVSDRAKALYVTQMLALNSQAARDEILKNGIPHLLRMLNTKQPDGRELTHAILRKVSGKDFPNTDIPSWTAWYNKLPKDRVPTNKR